MKIFFFGIFTFSFICALAQIKIEGKISDINGKPIVNASVLINKKASDDIIAYAITDNKGFYKITFTTNLNEIDIKRGSFRFHADARSIGGTRCRPKLLLLSPTVESLGL